MPVLAWTRTRSACGAAALLLVVAAIGDRRVAAARESQPLAALAPVEVLASGFRRPSAVAVEMNGAVLVVDRAAGTLTRIGGDGAREVLARGLHGPNGVAVDGAGNIFVLEAAGRRIVRVGADGHVAAVASTLRQPRAIAVGPDGRVWVAMRDENGGDDVVALLDESGALTEVAAGFVAVEALAATRGAVSVAMARLGGERGPRRTTVARMAIHEDGTVGRVEPLLSAEVDRAAGLDVDALGDLFVSGVSPDEGRGRDGVVLKRHRTGEVTGFISRLRGAAALAFAPNGDLIALERSHPRRVLRLRAPPPPAPAVPAFTNRTPLPIGGRALPGDRVQLFPPSDAETPHATTIADARGAFTLPAPLVPNERTDWLFRATGAGGRGLASPAVTVSIVHDDVLPSVMMLEPRAGAHVRGSVLLRGRGEDEGSGVAAVSFLLDDATVASVGNPAPPDALVASAVLETGGMAEGPHALTTTAADRAGNSRAAAQLLVVDRTPPDTAIVSGPGAETVERRVRFGVAGSDIWSPAIEFSWRLDEGGWSAYGPAPVIELVDLTPGPHRFEVRARDLAGNEDPTPAAYAFVIRSLRVHVLEPADGATITSSSVWVRGTVEGGIGEVAVRLVPPPEFAGIIAAPVEAGAFAMEIPADPALAPLTLQATDGSGATAETSVAMTLAPDGMPVEPLDLWPPGGVAPLTVHFGLHGFSGAPISIDADGDGAAEFSVPAGADDFSTTYTRAGVYVPTVRITTPDGDLLVRRGLVEVYDPVALDIRLQAVWAGFREALRNGDVDAAVSFIVAERRMAWADYFRVLPREALRDVDEIFPAITFVDAGAGGAQYEMVVDQGGVASSYAVWFQIDTDGRWRLWRL